MPDAWVRVDVLDVSDVIDTTDKPEMMDEAVIIISSESDVEQAPPSTSTTNVFTPTKCPPLHRPHRSPGFVFSQ